MDEHSADSGEAGLDPADLTELGLSACWGRLRAGDVGRIAVVNDGRPEIFPVNYVVDHGTVVFRTADGTKLTAALSGVAVAFESDGYDPESGRAWSVVIKGQAEEIRRLHEMVDTVDLPLTPWQGSPKPRFVRIVPAVITGRSFAVVDGSAWNTQLTPVRRAALD